MSASTEVKFSTAKEERDYGFSLIMDIILAAKAGRPYKEEIKEIWDLAYKNEEVMAMLAETILSLSKNNAK